MFNDIYYINNYKKFPKNKLYINYNNNSKFYENIEFISISCCNI